MKFLNRKPLSLRDTLWLAAGLALVAAPHAERLPWWITSLAITLGVWRVYLGRTRLPLPRKWVLLAIVAAATVGVFLNYRTVFGRDAGVALLVVMLALKLLETRVQRDGMLLIFLSYFLVITSFLYSQTIATALYMLVCAGVITATMVGLNYTGTHPGYQVQLRAAGVMLAQAAPLMLVLFVLFPRIQGPLWGLPHDAHAGITGLSDTMAPGSFTSLTLSDAVAFRVEFKSAIPQPKHLYWRGPVMWDFDGRVWTAPRYYYGEPRFDTSGAPVEYTVTIEPHNKRWLFAIDLPGQVPPRAAASSDFQLLAFSPVISRVRYDMTSYLETRHGTEENPMALNRALNLPPGYNPRSLELARTLRLRFTDDKVLMREVLAMFRTQNFFYTLSPPPLGTDSVDDFLFNTRRGFCEYYASAFTFLMRAAGIPARVVTGYQGGEINPVGNYMIVRQADAHAWTEVWFRDEGWVRVDPTAAVSPQRVESGIAAAIPATDPLPFLVRGDLVWLRQLRLTWDSLANSWNQWVLGYNPERQRRLLSHAGIDEATWRTLAVILLAATGIVVFVLSLIMLRKLRATVRDPAKRAYLRFCAKLGRRGIARDLAEGPVDYAARLARLRPDLAPGADAITRLYVVLRYGSGGNRRALDELQRQVQQFRA
jgi:protein-glutamine gamma-glutamyltransferase